MSTVSSLTTPPSACGRSVPVVLIHPHDVTRFGLEHAWSLGDDVYVNTSVDHWSSAIDALDTTSLAKRKPRVVLIGLWPQAIEPIDVVKLMQLFREPAWLIMTPEPSESEWNVLREAGAHGYLHQMALTSRVTSAIQWVDAGRNVIDPSSTLQPAQPVRFDRTTKAICRPSATTVADSMFAELSPREQEVIDGLALGLTNQQIADRMFLSVKTIETYRSRLSRKLNVRDRAAIVAVHRRSSSPLCRTPAQHPVQQPGQHPIDRSITIRVD